MRFKLPENLYIANAVNCEHEFPMYVPLYKKIDRVRVIQRPSLEVIKIRLNNAIRLRMINELSNRAVGMILATKVLEDKNYKLVLKVSQTNAEKLEE